MTPIDIFALACTMIALACGSWALVDARRAARARREADIPPRPAEEDHPEWHG